MERFIFDQKDFETVRQVLEQDAESSVEVYSAYGTDLKFDSDENELYLKSMGTSELIISRISIHKRHTGVGTKILNLLIDYAKRYNFQSIMAESVLTPEMVAFCLKHGFEFDKRFAIDEENMLGNWYLGINRL